MYSDYPNLWRGIDGNAPEGVMAFSANTGASDGPSIEMYGDNMMWSGTTYKQGSINYISNTAGLSTTPPSIGHNFLSYNLATNTYTSAMAITNDGKVIIGSDLIDFTVDHVPGTYDLYVERGILTEKLKVASSGDVANWSDFVFNSGYKLMPLSRVESFVKANKHLPEIPSAAEVAKDGIDVASMDAKLLQKIEELTLYVIQQQKEIDELKKKVEAEN